MINLRSAAVATVAASIALFTAACTDDPPQPTLPDPCALATLEEAATAVHLPLEAAAETTEAISATHRTCSYTPSSGGGNVSVTVLPSSTWADAEAAEGEAISGLGTQAYLAPEGDIHVLDGQWVLVVAATAVTTPEGLQDLATVAVGRL